MPLKIILFIAVAGMIQGGLAGTPNKGEALTDTFKKAKNGSLSQYSTELLKTCFSTQTKRFIVFGSYLALSTEKAAEKIAEDGGSDHTAELMKKIAANYRKMAKTIWPNVLQLKFGEALDAGQRICDTITAAVGEIVKTIKEKDPGAADRAFSRILEIQKEAFRRSVKMNTRVMNCIEGTDRYWSFIEKP